MRIISDILNREFDSVEACLAAEAAFIEKEDLKAEVMAELTEALKEYEKAEERYFAAMNRYDELFKNSCDCESCNDNDCCCDCHSDRPIESSEKAPTLYEVIEQLIGADNNHTKKETSKAEKMEIPISIEELLDAIFG